MLSRVIVLAGLVFACLVSACTSISTHSSAVPDVIVITPASVASSLKVLQAVSPHLDDLDAEFIAFPRPGDLGRDYYNAEEIEAMERLLFRFLAMQTSLWDIVNSFGGLDAEFADDATDAKAQVLSISATLLMASHTALVVEQFAEQPIGIKQMNEVYFRSEIPFGSYDHMRLDVTDPELVQAVKDSKAAYMSELADQQSALAVLASSGGVYADLIARVPALHDEAAQRLQEVAGYFPSYKDAERMAKRDTRSQHKMRYAMRSLLFKDVSRLKTPTAHIVEFTDDQKRQIFSLLEPGDLVLTYTAGYMSDVFIPGAFKHGITYIGTAEDRAPLKLSVDVLSSGERYQPEKVSANLKNSSLPDGTNADMIEAVAEGVIFNDLEHIMDTHVNRMLVLRPRLSPEERAAFLVEVYSYLGDGYDFRFDFADASQQVCTEVIYRAINGKGEIDFDLTVRDGHETLSADDIANYHLEAATESFDFVLLVESVPDSKDNAALVYTGVEGEQKLKALMAEAAEK